MPDRLRLSFEDAFGGDALSAVNSNGSKPVTATSTIPEGFSGGFFPCTLPVALAVAVTLVGTSTDGAELPRSRTGCCGELTNDFRPSTDGGSGGALPPLPSLVEVAAVLGEGVDGDGGCGVGILSSAGAEPAVFLPLPSLLLLLLSRLEVAVGSGVDLYVHDVIKIALGCQQHSQ